MLKRITLTNFFSFGEETTIELNPDVNLLVGINGSGKSNFFRALEFLYEGVAGDGIEKLLINKWGGLDNVVNLEGEVRNFFRLDFEFQPQNKYFYIYSVEVTGHRNIGYHFKETLQNGDFRRNNGKPEYLFEVEGGTMDETLYGKWRDSVIVPYEEILNHKYNAKELFLSQNRITHTVHSLINFIKSLKVYNSFDTNYNSPIRQPSTLGQGIALNQNGDNLNSVIQNLQNNHALEYEQIEEKLRDINPNFKGLSFNFFGSKVYLSLREKNLRKVIPIKQISDGTLQYIALLVIFYNPERGGVVTFDEPETGLHPDMLSYLAEAIKYTIENNRTQLFIATHSAILLNSFEPNQLLIFEKNKDNETKVLRLSEQQLKALPKGVPTGQLWLSGKLGGKRFQNTIQETESQVNKALDLEEYLDDGDKEKLLKLRDKIDHLLREKNMSLPSLDNITYLNDKVQQHFSELNIYSYKVLSDLNIKNLSQVNIVAGANNTGKTSLLEAVYLATQMNNMNALINLEQFRGKFENGISAKWLHERVVNNGYRIYSTFNKANNMLRSDKSRAGGAVSSKLNYLSDLELNTRSIPPHGRKAIQSKYISKLRLYENEEPKLYTKKTVALCRAAFTSPYRHNTALVIKAHEEAIKGKYFDKIIDFIRTKLDDTIEDISLINDNRFMVSSTKFEQAIDITKYGEGMQRIFEIALLMGYCQNGVICIDELDSAIHKSLLIEFTKFIQEFALEFNVQVFLTTHSKECIDAFVENDYHNEDITAFALTRDEEDKIVCKYLKGDKLHRLINSSDIDIR